MSSNKVELCPKSLLSTQVHRQIFYRVVSVVIVVVVVVGFAGAEAFKTTTDGTAFFSEGVVLEEEEEDVFGTGSEPSPENAAA